MKYDSIFYGGLPNRALVTPTLYTIFRNQIKFRILCSADSTEFPYIVLKGHY